MIKQFLNIHKAWIRSHIPIGGYVILNQTPTGGPHSSPVHICQRHADTQLRRRQLQLCSDLSNSKNTLDPNTFHMSSPLAHLKSGPGDHTANRESWRSREKH